METELFIFLLGIAFTAGFIDSIAGGGGLIFLPGLLVAGVPPHFALGTNKFSVFFGTGTAAVNYIRKKLVSFKLIAAGIGFSVVGSFVGSRVILHLDEALVGKLIIFLIPLAIAATLYPKREIISQHLLSKKDLYLKVPLICLSIGFYDGVFGPGTGSFLAIALYSVLKLHLVEASANARVFNWFSNLGALGGFLLSGKVMFTLGIPLAIASMLGNYIGSHLAIKKGVAVIKPVLVVVCLLLIGTLAKKYLF